MKKRCNNPSNKDSKYYYDKGITYCEEWDHYENFQNWALNNGYSDNFTLDRIDGNLPYCPQNCRWITIEEQQRNRSNCLYFYYKGQTKTLSEWARIFNINRSTLHDRIFKFNYSFEEAIKNPIRRPRNSFLIEYNGEIFTQAKFADKLGVTPQCVSKLRKKGYSTNEIAQRFIDNI
jgi:hypothetical protein